MNEPGTAENATAGMVCACGLPMSKNPHPDAGDPGPLGVQVGHVWVCIPCTVATRHRWANRALRAEGAIAAHRSTKTSPYCGHSLNNADRDLWRVLEAVESEDVQAALNAALSDASEGSTP